MTLVVAAAQLGLAALLAFNHASVVVMVVCAYTVGAIGSHWLGQSIHETSHRLAARTPLANRVLAWVANAPMVLPIPVNTIPEDISSSNPLRRSSACTNE